MLVLTHQSSVEFQSTVRDGLVIPAHLDTPHAVSFVLSQKRGRLNMKHVQKGLLCVYENWPIMSSCSTGGS